MTAVGAIEDLCLVNPSKGEKAPADYETLEKSSTGVPCHVLNATGSKYFLAVKRVSLSSPTFARALSYGAIGPVSPSPSSTGDIASPTSPSGDSAHSDAAGAGVARGRLVVSDIRVAKRDEIPFGYTPISKTIGGLPVLSKLYICFRTTMWAPIRNVAIIHPPKNEKVPAGHVVLKANLNEGSPQSFTSAPSSDLDDASLCYSKGIDADCLW